MEAFENMRGEAGRADRKGWTKKVRLLSFRAEAKLERRISCVGRGAITDLFSWDAVEAKRL